MTEDSLVAVATLGRKEYLLGNKKEDVQLLSTGRIPQTTVFYLGRPVKIIFRHYNQSAFESRPLEAHAFTNVVFESKLTPQSNQVHLADTWPDKNFLVQFIT